MKIQIKLLVMVCFFGFSGCSYERSLDPNRLPTKFKIKILNEKKEPVKNKIINLNASWQLSFYQALVDDTQSTTNDSGILESALNIKGKFFIVTISTDIFNDSTQYQVNPLNLRFN
jgi:hypothetical protein